MKQHIPKGRDLDPGREQRSYLIGGVLSLLLTLAAFGVVWAGILSGGTELLIVAGLGALQMVVQFRFFLHLDLRRSHRDDLHLVLFTVLIVSLMVGGSLWILFNQHMRMM